MGVMEKCINKDARPKTMDDALTLLSVITRREIAPFLNLLRDYIIADLSDEEKVKVDKIFERAIMEEMETEEETELFKSAMKSAEEKKTME
jgi:hypothetical protein